MAKTNQRGYLLIFGILIVVLGLALFWQRGEGGREGSSPALEAKPASNEASAASPDRPESSGSPRPAAAAPIKPRPPKEIREALEAQARKVVEKDLGGAKDEDKQALMAAIRELEALRTGGLSDQHPSMLLSLARFSRKLDRLAAYNEEEWRADAVAFLEKRLSELDALPDGESPAALQERWWQELGRDDLPEAILLRYRTKPSLRDDLQNLIEVMKAPSK